MKVFAVIAVAVLTSSAAACSRGREPEQRNGQTKVTGCLEAGDRAGTYVIRSEAFGSDSPGTAAATSGSSAGVTDTGSATAGTGWHDAVAYRLTDPNMSQYLGARVTITGTIEGEGVGTSGNAGATRPARGSRSLTDTGAYEGMTGVGGPGAAGSINPQGGTARRETASLPALRPTAIAKLADSCVPRR